MKQCLLLATALSAFALESPSAPPAALVHKSRGVLIHALPSTPWCEFGSVSIQPARFEPAPRRKAGPASSPSDAQLASARPFLASLDNSLPDLFQPLSALATSGPKSLVVAPRLRKLRVNRIWLNLISFPLLQSPIASSNMRTDFALIDGATGNEVGTITITGNNFLTNQLDLRRFRYSFSRLGQARSLARAQTRSALKKWNPLKACTNPHPTPPTADGSGSLPVNPLEVQ